MGKMGDIFRAHGPEYRERFAERMSADQLRAMQDIERCYTDAAGAVRWHCADCGHDHFTLQGCGNRHCPACGKTAAEQWLQKQCALLLPGVTYHLVTFTVPESLRRPIRSHPRELLELLMKLAASTLLDLCKNPKWVGGVPGVTAVLHTWTRQGEYHPHVHFIATGGALSSDGVWHKAHPKYLVPVQGLSPVFRARFRDALRDDFPELFRTLHPRVWRNDWVVHSKPVGSGKAAYRYLARYVYRVAFSEGSIIAHTPEKITLRYRESNTNKKKTLRLKPFEFLRRFLQHVLPSRFCKIRHYGLHHSSKRSTIRLLQATMALALNIPLLMLQVETVSKKPSCPLCQAPMTYVDRLNRLQWKGQNKPVLPAPRGPP